ncbi:hypothetical protein B0H16DRAFT_1367214 [Mycena metata]|uniref:BTB domain-containing protein n=1 Tax=Mycena metata TaxID=1033252 RepID=A0AAD7JM70_9AGAR|nr:hypothetical protein B0H16DRAFT_1367214 [Mycena metata]
MALPHSLPSPTNSTNFGTSLTMQGIQNLTRTDGLWFSIDAHVVLRAEDQIFRVPRSILAARSSVFQAMFEFPRPATDTDTTMEPDEMMDGSPVIRLHDSAVDVEPFLRAIFDSSYFMPPPSKISFRAVLGVLRLSHKYDVDYLHKRALLHLETVYVVDIRDEGINDNGLGYTGADMDWDLAAIAILREVGASWLLPAACYNVGTFWFRPGGRSGWAALPSELAQVCARLPAVHKDNTERLYHAVTRSSSCVSADKCDLLKFRFLKARGDPEDWINQDPLQLFYGDFDPERDQLLDAICHTCSDEAEEQHTATRARIWAELPDKCGLEHWNALKEQRRVALEGR